MAKILFVVMGFASHQTWAEGYQRYVKKNKDAIVNSSSDNHHQRKQQQHEVELEIVSGERWKFRMMVAIGELECKIVENDYDIVVVDGMLDVTVLVALVKSQYLSRIQSTSTELQSGHHHQSSQQQQHLPKQQRRLLCCPKFLLYMHENQLTTPYTSQDRDYNKANPTHWHYGMAHYRSLMVADGILFNSYTHQQAFSAALPKVINEQCPRDSVDWHLTRCNDLLQRKCTVLPYGLELDELYDLVVSYSSSSSLSSPRRDGDNHNDNINDDHHDQQLEEKAVPVILWNARLEEDKDPGTFLDLLNKVRQRYGGGTGGGNRPLFRLVILGSDPSKDQRWTKRIKDEFSKELLYCGWCNDRSDYAKWLHESSIVISTAQHETFGISIVESVYCGGMLPLLPNRLSYPELFPPSLTLEGDSAGGTYLYTNALEDGVDKLYNLLMMVTNDTRTHKESVSRIREGLSKYRWDVMGPIYHKFFNSVADADLAVNDETWLIDLGLEVRRSLDDSNRNDDQLMARIIENGKSYDGNVVDNNNNNSNIQVIDDATDRRVQLYRPKSLRNHTEYNRQLTILRGRGIDPAVHGGRRAMVRLLEAVAMGAKIEIISFLTTRDLAERLLLTSSSTGYEEVVLHRTHDVPIYVSDNQDVLNTIRGQKLNVGDSILAMVQFPMVSDLHELIKNPPILILEDVRNAENVGSILRTAFCLGITSVVASPTAWAALKDTRAARCSMGTMYYHRYYKPSTTTSSLRTTIEQIREGGITVYGIEIGETSVPVGPHAPGGTDVARRHWAAVLGNEDTGLTGDVSAVCDTIVFVPQAHGDSLNVGHAAAIAMFELGRGGPIPQHDGRAACT